MDIHPDRAAVEPVIDPVVDLGGVGRSHVGSVGGKAANLGELIALGGIRVPSGFCVTTSVFRSVVVPAIEPCTEELAALSPDEAAVGARLAERIRAVIASVELPEALVARIRSELLRFAEGTAFAVRSSGTTEDLGSTSSAGQHDSLLNVVGASAVLDALRRCWSSAFSDRAIAYRSNSGMDPRAVEMAVVIQCMVEPTASGVLFTADPVSGHRRSAIVEAVPGLGEALVSGTAAPDGVVIRRDASIERRSSNSRLLSDRQLLALVSLGRRVEAHFGRPQDIEWCLDDDGFAIVQSRPITTLFPIPASESTGDRVYVSVGHGQMMTDAMTPLGASVWRMASAARTAVAGSRLFVDVTEQLASSRGREALLTVMGRSDPLMRDALETVIGTGFVPAPAAADPVPRAAAGAVEAPDASELPDIMERIRRSLEEIHHRADKTTGPAVAELLRTDLAEGLLELRDPRSRAAVRAGFEATWWLNDHLQDWLGESNAADALSRSPANDITAEMGLALLDVADVVRPSPQATAALRHATDESLLMDLERVAGGGSAAAALSDFLARYGMRCVGEIDLGRPRWRERPTTLVPAILANVENFAAGESTRRVSAGRAAALEAEEDLLRRLRRLSDGETKAAETKRMIARLRSFIGYREFPKYALITRFATYRGALLAEARRLAAEGALDHPDDIFLLTFDEVEQALRSRTCDRALLARRREQLRADSALRPPRVITSDGEMFDGSYRRADLGPDVLAGLGISRGTVEGRARVLDDFAQAALEPGDILVTTHTDPSWSPVFLNAAGLVTEVGGLTTHGAVIAREYGLVAVVGVTGAVSRIPDGRRIRVSGTNGTVELLDDEPV